MASARDFVGRRMYKSQSEAARFRPWTCISCQQARSSARFSTSTRAKQEQGGRSGPFRTRLRTALRNTNVQWKPIPVGLGIGFLGAFQVYRVRAREKNRQEEKYASEAEDVQGVEEGHTARPDRRKRIRPSGPWCVRKGQMTD